MTTTPPAPLTGLTTAEATARLAQHGPNVLSAKNGQPWYAILWRQFTDMLVVILLLAAGVSFYVGEVPDALVIVGIVLLNASIGFFQEFRTEKTLQALQSMVHPTIRVRRDGETQTLATEDLVPGDIVLLGEGDKIPADGLLAESHSLRVEEAALTGESVPVDKAIDDTLAMGTSVVHGSGVYTVTATGMNTEFGEIARLTTETTQAKSPLQLELERIGFFVTKVTGVICVFLFGIGLVRGSTLVESLLFSVSVAIAAVPEGLPTTVTIALALGAAVLARKHAIVKRLSSVETLGAVSTICSDKTGTLTRNEMTVRALYLADRSVYSVGGVGYDPQAGQINYTGGNDLRQSNSPLLQRLITICRQCNEATLKDTNGVWSVMGDPTEGALLTLAAKHAEQAPVPNAALFPFDSDRKMMSVIHDDTVLVKGSPDQLLAQCTHWSDGTTTHPLDSAKREAILAHYQRLATQALRVLAFADRPVAGTAPTTAETAETGLVFVGLVGMIDPPRESVKAAVAKCRTAGVRVVVITGDAGLTAKAIAQELGIVKGDAVRVIEGHEVAELSDQQLLTALSDRETAVIFARSQPAQKMRIVSLLQDSGEIVAMTGDGVNDAPALKKANIGIAMGITGTEVSKEAATMILLNDSFTSIVTAVEEGRRIYRNLRKFIWFIFACNIGELVTIFTALLFQFPAPLTAVLILCIDLGTDILPAIALGIDPAPRDIMAEPPRDPKAKVMNKKFVLNFVVTGFVIGLSVTGGFLYTIMRDGWVWADGISGEWFHATSVAFAGLVFVQLVNTFSARSFTRTVFRRDIFANHFILWAILTSTLLVSVILYVPIFNTLLKTTPLTLHDWGVVAIVSLIPLAYVELAKKLRFAI